MSANRTKSATRPAAKERDGLLDKIAVQLAKLDVTKYGVWEELKNFSQDTSVDELEVFPDEIRLLNDRGDFSSEVNLYLRLGHSIDGKMHYVVEGAPGRIFGKLANGKIRDLRIEIDTRIFEE